MMSLECLTHIFRDVSYNYVLFTRYLKFHIFKQSLAREFVDCF